MPRKVLFKLYHNFGEGTPIGFFSSSSMKFCWNEGTHYNSAEKSIKTKKKRVIKIVLRKCRVIVLFMWHWLVVLYYNTFRPIVYLGKVSSKSLVYDERFEFLKRKHCSLQTAIIYRGSNSSRLIRSICLWDVELVLSSYFLSVLL